MQAVAALNRADAFFILDKGREKHDLVALRHEILDRYVEKPDYRLVEARDAERDLDRPTSGYSPAVDDWRGRRADIYERMIRDELPEDGGCGAFLVWGDPALYDSTIGILEDVLARGTVGFEYEVIPGVSSVSALVAKHRVGLNQVGKPVQITTGRRLAEGFPEDVDDVVVMLDSRQAFAQLPDEEGLEIYWGAYVGSPDEILISGPVAEVADRIVEERARARERKGWIMDTYLLRRRGRGDARLDGRLDGRSDG